MKYETRCKQKEAEEERLKRDMEEFVAKGGKVQHIEAGVCTEFDGKQFGRTRREVGTDWSKS